jgi:nitroimidazol reductase NimA-like FMN-containing flavoprotein (pyridoxamine 5'-phosphate oxidase superfamily)
MITGEGHGAMSSTGSDGLVRDGSRPEGGGMAQDDQREHQHDANDANDDSDLVELARSVIDANRYMVLGTADADGLPHVSPVYFTPVRHRDLYWVSSPRSRHSANVASRPEVSIVVFDSQVPIGGAQAVYMAARAELVPDAELEECARVFSGRYPELKEFGPDDLRAPADLRLYRARVHEHSVLVRGSDPRRGRGVDSRFVVQL